jgi:hypothetical protein
MPFVHGINIGNFDSMLKHYPSPSHVAMPSYLPQALRELPTLENTGTIKVGVAPEGQGGWPSRTLARQGTPHHSRQFHGRGHRLSLA